MSPPPLPRIKAAEILDIVMKRSGDPALVAEVGAAIDTNVKARKDAADKTTKWDAPVVPPPAFAGATGPGSPGNPLSEAQAQALFEDLARLDYIPFDYPRDGCFARAHEMSRIMAERGVASGKVFNTAAPNALKVPGTEFGDITWRYHVAPIVNVTGSDGVTREMVFDPSINKDRPMTITEWQTRSGGPAGQRIDTTSSDTYYFRPANPGDSADKSGGVLTDPTHASTNATLDYMSVQRDLVRAGLKP
jgi:hypothetical protein